MFLKRALQLRGRWVGVCEEGASRSRAAAERAGGRGASLREGVGRGAGQVGWVELGAGWVTFKACVYVAIEKEVKRFSWEGNRPGGAYSLQYQDLHLPACV